MTRKLPTLASLLLGAASAPAVVRALHPWSPVALQSSWLGFTATYVRHDVRASE
jgi:hypothetical protein